jgi:hypothetical protein
MRSILKRLSILARYILQYLSAIFYYTYKPVDSGYTARRRAKEGTITRVKHAPVAPQKQMIGILAELQTLAGENVPEVSE